LNLPVPVADKIQADKRVQRLAAIALAAMTARRTETEADAGFLGVTRSVGTQFLLGRDGGFMRRNAGRRRRELRRHRPAAATIALFSLSDFAAAAVALAACPLGA